MSKKNLMPPKSFPEPVDMRYSPIYGVHIFWAKKPWNVVAKCIEHFSGVNEIVLDPFCGVGVTPIEALRLHRRAVASDLDPLSVFMTEMIARPYSLEELETYDRTFSEVEENVKEDILSLYETKCDQCGGPGTIRESRFDSANEVEDPRGRDWKLKRIRLKCAHCGTRWKQPDKQDYTRLEEIEAMKLRHWFPTTKLIYNTRKSVYEGMTVADLYSKRNLTALSILCDAIFSLHSSRIRDLMKFTLSCSLHLMRMTDYKRASPQNFYIPKIDMTDLNVLEVFRKRRPRILKCKKEILRIWQNLEITDLQDWNASDFSELESGEGQIMIKKWDATRIIDIMPEESIDYVHTDPPYVDQVQYLELSLPWIG